MEVLTTHKTTLVVVQRDTTTTLESLPTGSVLVFTNQGGLPGPRGEEGEQGLPGLDGAADIPAVLDGGNF